MCDYSSFDYAEQLAIKSNISIDECHHSYLEYLLTNSSLSLNQIILKFQTNEEKSTDQIRFSEELIAMFFR